MSSYLRSGGVPISKKESSNAPISEIHLSSHFAPGLGKTFETAVPLAPSQMHNAHFLSTGIHFHAFQAYGNLKRGGTSLDPSPYIFKREILNIR